MTAQQVFELTMGIIDELLESGAVDPQNTSEYRGRTPKLLSVLQGEVGKSENVKTNLITSLNDTMSVSDFACINILPWGLASMLILEENETLATFCKSKYDTWYKNIPASEVDIIDVYSPYNTTSTEAFRW
jgi:hypothetical protein